MNTFVICNSTEEILSNMSCRGNVNFTLSAEDISALLQGKTLAGDYGGEYGVFITMEGKE